MIVGAPLLACLPACLTPADPPPLSRQAHAAQTPAHGADVTRDTTMGSKATCSRRERACWLAHSRLAIVSLTFGELHVITIVATIVILQLHPPPTALVGVPDASEETWPRLGVFIMATAEVFVVVQTAPEEDAPADPAFIFDGMLSSNMNPMGGLF